jgi:hypothetical protein
MISGIALPKQAQLVGEEVVSEDASAIFKCSLACTMKVRHVMTIMSVTRAAYGTDSATAKNPHNTTSHDHSAHSHTPVTRGQAPRASSAACLACILFYVLTRLMWPRKAESHKCLHYRRRNQRNKVASKIKLKAGGKFPSLSCAVANNFRLLWRLIIGLTLHCQSAGVGEAAGGEAVTSRWMWFAIVTLRGYFPGASNKLRSSDSTHYLEGMQLHLPPDCMWQALHLLEARYCGWSVDKMHWISLATPMHLVRKLSLTGWRAPVLVCSH